MRHTERARPDSKCPHNRIQHCPLYVGMHIAGGPSCWPKRGDPEQDGCAVEQGEAGYEELVAEFWRAHPKDFTEVTLAEREYEAKEQRARNMRLSGIH